MFEAIAVEGRIICLNLANDTSEGEGTDCGNDAGASDHFFETLSVPSSGVA